MNLRLIIVSAGRICLTIFIQICGIVAFGIVGLLPSILFPAGFIYGPIGTLVGIVYTRNCCIVGLAYTIIGTIILEKVPINTNRWWIIIGFCYVLFMILTAAGWPAQAEGYVVYLLDVWLAPLLWLGEIELFHYYLSSKMKKMGYHDKQRHERSGTMSRER